MQTNVEQYTSYVIRLGTAGAATMSLNIPIRSQARLEFAESSKPIAFFALLCFACCLLLMASDMAYASTECPKSAPMNDPFSDFDDTMTEEEKRLALHSDLAQKLASQERPCQPVIQQSNTATTGSEQKTNGANTAGEQSNSQSGQQNSSQTNQQDSKQAGQQPTDQNGEPGGTQGAGQKGPDRNSAQPSSHVQGTSTNGVPEQAPSGGGYTSPWDKPPEQSSNAGIVSLDPMLRSASQSKQSAQPVAGSQVESQAASSVSGEALPAKSTGVAAKKTESRFLNAYGQTVEQPRESIEDIASRYNSRKNGAYGSPGSTGTFQQKLNNGGSGRTTGKVQTISANDAAIKALQNRLATETDPAKKKQMQAEISRLKK